jgi:uncharacterized protein YbjT (DUF2867 family)
MILVVGSTGAVGGQICRMLRASGYEIRALVRGTSDLDSVDELGLMGADIAIGDLKDSNTLRAVCEGVSTVITTASSTTSRQEGDSIASVDRNGQLDLMSIASESGVNHAIYVSFHDMAEQFPLQDAKRSVEIPLQRGQMAHTILQPSFFMEVWLGEHLGFDAQNAKARIYGSGENRIPWISLVDVAKFAVAAVENPRVRNKTFELGGPDHLSPLEVVERFETLGGQPFDLEFVPEAALRSQMDSARSSLEKSFAGLMLAYHRGYDIDMTEALDAMPVDLTTIDEFAERTLFTNPEAA